MIIDHHDIHLLIVGIATSRSPHFCELTWFRVCFGRILSYAEIPKITMY